MVVRLLAFTGVRKQNASESIQNELLSWFDYHIVHNVIEYAVVKCDSCNLHTLKLKMEDNNTQKLIGASINLVRMFLALEYLNIEYYLYAGLLSLLWHFCRFFLALHFFLSLGKIQLNC